MPHPFAILAAASDRFRRPAAPARSRKADLLILCARIGYNPPA